MPPPLALGLLHGLLSTQTPRTISTLMNFTSCLRLRQKLPTIFKPPQEKSVRGGIEFQRLKSENPLLFFLPVTSLKPFSHEPLMQPMGN